MQIYYQCKEKELIIINIEITPKSRVKELLHKIFSKLEDIIFSIIQKFPERFIPSFLMRWLDRYTTKRIDELKRKIVRDRWNHVYLDQTVSKIRTRQQEQEKAPDKD